MADTQTQACASCWHRHVSCPANAAEASNASAACGSFERRIDWISRQTKAAARGLKRTYIGMALLVLAILVPPMAWALLAA